MGVEDMWRVQSRKPCKGELKRWLCKACSMYRLWSPLTSIPKTSLPLIILVAYQALVRDSKLQPILQKNHKVTKDKDNSPINQSR